MRIGLLGCLLLCLALAGASWAENLLLLLNSSGVVGVPVAFVNLGSSANPDIDNTANQSSYTNSSWTPPTDDLIYLCVGSKVSTGTPNTPTVTGNSLTWTQITTDTSGFPVADYRVTLFGADASGSTTGATTVAFGGQTQIGMAASFIHAQNVDLTSGVAAAFVQNPVGTGGSASTATVALAAASNGNNRGIACTLNSRNEAQTQRASWTLADTFNGSNWGYSIVTQYRGDAFETTNTSTWVTATAGWSIIGVEIKAQ